MKIFLVSCSVFVRLALASAWILYEKSSPPLSTSILLRRHVSNVAPLNIPERRIMRKERMGRLMPRKETPRLCILKGTCNQLYYRNRSEFKKLFEARPTFRRNYDNLYQRKMKGRQAIQQHGEYYAGSFIYMSPNLMIVRPVNAHDWLPRKKPAYSGLREILFTKTTQTQEAKSERMNKDQGSLRKFSGKPSTSKETSTTAKNGTVSTEASPQGAKANSTSQNSFHEVQRNLIQPYAVKEEVDENEPAAGDGRSGLRGKPLFRSNIKDEMNAEVRRTSHNGRIVKIIPLTEGDKTIEKNVQSATINRYADTTDHFQRITPSQHSQEPDEKLKERLVNRKEQSKNLKILVDQQQNSLGTTTDNGNRTTPMSNSGVKNRENFRAVEITPSYGVATALQKATAETKHTSLANLDEIRGSIQKTNRKFSSSLTESELQGFKPQPALLPAGKQVTPPSKTGSTPNQVTFKALDVENVTHVPEDFTTTWKFQNNPSPMGKVLNTVDQITSGHFTAPEELTDRPSTSELPKPRTEVKERESLSKNSRKMHFGQDSRPNELLEQVDQRRSDILISDNFDDYFDDEYNLSYLEKLKRNNSLDALKNLTSASLIPLIPMVIQHLRQEKIPPEDISLLSSAFGDLWPTVLELSNSTNVDMLPILKMKDESDLKNVLQSIQSDSLEPTTAETTVSLDYDSYDYMEKFKDLYEDLLTVGQEVDEGKRPEESLKEWKRSVTLSEDQRPAPQG